MRYLLVELPDELPLLGELLEPELPLPLMPEEVPPEEELPPEDVLPEAPLAPELEPDLSKWASHSERDTCPSPFVSTDEKLGEDELLEVPPADDDGLLAEEDDEDGLLDDEDGVLDEDDGVLDDDDGLLDDEEDCATASVDSANSTAAVVMLRVLGMDQAPVVVSRTAHMDVQALCRRRARVPVW